jgi:hypothetical protein
MNEVLIGTGNHRFNILVTIGEQLVALIVVIVCINLRMGIFVLIIPGYFQTTFKQGFGWWFINNKIVHLKINPWQSWIAPLGAGLCYTLLFWGIREFLLLFTTPLITIVIFVLLGIYILPGVGYFLPLGLLGGYDDHTLEDLRKAVDLSGPSKIVVKPWHWGASIGSRISSLYNRFPLQYAGVGEEILQLMKDKKQNMLKKAPEDID